MAPTVPGPTSTTTCEKITREVCVGSQTELREFNGEADHVHLAPLTVIRQYIEGQKRPL